MLRGFDDKSIACEQSGQQRVEDVVEGVVPRHDRCNDSQRHMLHLTLLVKHLHSMLVQMTSLLYTCSVQG